MKTAKVKILLCFVIMVGLLVTACGAPGSTTTTAPGSTTTTAPGSTTKTGSEKFKIGYVVSDYTTDTFAFLVKQNFENIVKKDHPDWELTIQEAKWDVSKELAITESFIQNNCDVIIFHAVDSDGTGASVEACNKAGIPVITIINPVTDGEKIYVGGSNYDCGKTMAEKIRDKIPQNGKVTIMQGAAGATNSIDRAEGFKENLKRDDVKIIDEQNGNWLVETAMDITENWMQAHPQIDLIVSVSDVMTPGIVETLKAAGRMDKTMVISVDGTKEGLEMVKNGELQFDMLYNATTNAQNAVDVCKKIIAGEKKIDDVLYQFEPITAAEVDDLMKWYFLGT